MSDTEEVLSKEEMYSLWLEMCPDKERLKDAFRKAVKDFGFDMYLLEYSNNIQLASERLDCDFESWYSEFIKEWKRS